MSTEKGLPLRTKAGLIFACFVVIAFFIFIAYERVTKGPSEKEQLIQECSNLIVERLPYPSSFKVGFKGKKTIDKYTNYRLIHISFTAKNTFGNTVPLYARCIHDLKTKETDLEGISAR